MTEDTKAKIKRLADEYAHCYAFVGDDTMPLKRTELHAAIDSIDARGEAVPFAWCRAFRTNDSPSEPGGEIDVDFVYGDDQPKDDGLAEKWFPVYRAAPLCTSQDGFVPRGFICPQCGHTRVMSPKCPDCNYDADAHSAGQDEGAPDNSKCKFASGGTDCVTWCGDQACLAKTWIDVPLPGRESTAQTDYLDFALLDAASFLSQSEKYGLAEACRTAAKHFAAMRSESPAQAGIAQSFGPVINPPTVLTTTAQAGAGEALLPCPFCGTVTGLDVEPACVSCSVCLAEGPIGVAERLPGESAKRWNQRAAAPNVLAKEIAHLECKFDDACERADKAETNVLAMREALQAFVKWCEPFGDKHENLRKLGLQDLADAARAALASPLPEPRAGRDEIGRAVVSWWKASGNQLFDDTPEFVKLALGVNSVAASPIPTPEPSKDQS